jgi:hypothetical protein
MPLNPTWKIKVGCKAEIIAEFTAPKHRLNGKHLDNFLRALVARYRTDGPEDMLPYYLNARKGGPDRSSLADPRPYPDPERRECGVFCGDWDCYAYATLEISVEQAEALEKNRQQNRQAS